MISRKKILSRSQSEMDSNYASYQCDDEVWNNKEKLYSDHIQEIYKKWEQLDDEIWGKIICMERNRRIAKAYARVPLLTINGGFEGFDGYKIGLNGFENPLEDHVIKRVKHNIGKGVRIKIDEMGNIIIKRLSQHDVIIRGYEKDQCAIAKDVLEANGELPAETSVKLFDIKKFQANITRELRSSYPNRAKLENQCIVGVGFVKDADNVLELPVWCMLINIVALDMLRSRLPPTLYRNQELNGYASNVPKFISIFDRAEQGGQSRSVQDEDPYSVPSLPKLITDPSGNSQMSSGYSTGGYAGDSRPMPDRNGVTASGQPRRYAVNGSGNIPNHVQKQRSEKENNPIPPELPPRDFAKIGSPASQPVVKKTKSRNFAKVFRFRKSSGDRKKKNEKEEDENLQSIHSQQQQQQQSQLNELEYEDPYYCGMQARVSNFGARQRKSMASPNAAQGFNHMYQQQASSNQAQYLRKANSNGYLNSLFNPTSNFYPQSKNSPYSYYSQYDSSFESDPYAISSNENADYYAIYGHRLSGANFPPTQASAPYAARRVAGSANPPAGSGSPRDFNYFSSSNQAITASKVDRYASEWD